MFKGIEGFFAKMIEMKFGNTEMIADTLDMSVEENAAYRRLLSSLLGSKRAFKKELEIAKENKSKKTPMATRYNDSPE